MVEKTLENTPFRSQMEILFKLERCGYAGHDWVLFFSFEGMIACSL